VRVRVAQDIAAQLLLKSKGLHTSKLKEKLFQGQIIQ